MYPTMRWDKSVDDNDANQNIITSFAFLGPYVYVLYNVYSQINRLYKL
jgi:hypothetical protein